MKDPQDSPESSQLILTAGQWKLAWLKFRRNRVAVFAGGVLLCMYLAVFFSGFVAPYGIDHRFVGRDYVPPQGVHFLGPDGFHLRPFVYGLKLELEAVSGRTVYRQDRSKRYPIRFFVRGDEHSICGTRSSLHLFGIESDGKEGVFLLGTDRQGRDMLTRVLYGGRISLTVGLVGVMLSVLLGSVLGGVSGYFGGAVDALIQRLIEILRSFPRLPLWMALSAAIPADFDQMASYFMITIILSVIGWTGLARQVRGQIMALRNEDFVLAAELMGASRTRVIFRHLLPAVMGYIIVIATLAIPGMILGESALSFLGFGIRPPMVSWGSLLSASQSLVTLIYYKWLLAPALFIIVTVLCFNFLGDGLRDAADPYSSVRP